MFATQLKHILIGSGFIPTESTPIGDGYLRQKYSRKSDGAAVYVDGSEQHGRVDITEIRSSESPLSHYFRSGTNINTEKVETTLTSLREQVVQARQAHKHLYIAPENCRCDYDRSCNVCDGGLAICSLCGLIEASLTTDCSGQESYRDYGDRVYAGEIDFIGGRWVPGAYSIHAPSSVLAARIAATR
jgi:hypothetical protein